MQILKAGLNREDMRIAALHSLGIYRLDKMPVVDALVRLAVDVFKVPFASVTIVGVHRHVFVSKTGITIDSTPRCDSICTHTVAEDRPKIIRDISRDHRWCAQPIVVECAQLGFYAGIPVHFDKQAVGTFCLMDHQPRPHFSDDHLHLLTGFALIVETLFAHLPERRADDRAVQAGAA